MSRRPSPWLAVQSQVRIQNRWSRHHQRVRWIARRWLRPNILMGCAVLAFTSAGVFLAVVQTTSGDPRLAIIRAAGSSPPTAIPARAPRSDGGRAVIIDGDTFALGSERIRILNIDTPETHEPRCAAELTAGLKAKERLADLLRSGSLTIEREGHDRYGRTLARVYAGGQDVGEALMRQGHALPYQPGAAARNARVRSWCG